MIVMRVMGEREHDYVFRGLAAAFTIKPIFGMWNDEENEEKSLD